VICGYWDPNYTDWSGFFLLVRKILRKRYNLSINLCRYSMQSNRRGLNPFLSTFKNGTLHQRLVQLFTQLKDLDLIAARGSRTVFGGLQTTAGQDLLKNYLLTSGANLESVLKQKSLFDWDSGFTLADFEGKRVPVPAGATHLALRIGYLTLDFENFTSSFVATETVYLSPTAWHRCYSCSYCSGC